MGFSRRPDCLEDGLLGMNHSYRWKGSNACVDM